MRTSPPRILPIFRSEMQLHLLAALLLQPQRGWTMDELGVALGVPTSSVLRELNRATDAGLVLRDDARRPHRFSASVASPFYEPLRQLLDLSVGVETELRAALQGLPIDLALLHGSWVTGGLGAESDIDLLIVGDAQLPLVRRKVRPIGKQAGRAIDVTVFRRDEFQTLAARRASFVRRLMEGETRPLIGDLTSILDR